MRRAVSRRTVAPTRGNLAVEPDWRREVANKLNAYRTRHGGMPAGPQPALPFEPVLPAVEDPETPNQFLLPEPDVKPPTRRPSRVERVEISIPKQEMASGVAGIRSAGTGHRAGGATAGLFPVASLRERRAAASLDFAFLLFSYGGVLALFWALGGRIGWNKLDAVVAGATLALFYAQYFALFTVFGGSTPGMMLRGLRVVSFDGAVPTSRQMVWRSFGYLVSAGTCFLGFLWAWWDEDHLCWQDRISQTYLTTMEDLAGNESLAPPAGHRPAPR